MLEKIKKLINNNAPQNIESSSIIGRKPNQEDSFFVSEKKFNRQLIFVADGVGGHSHGEFASNKTVEIFKEAFSHISDKDIIPDFLRNTAYQAARAVIEQGEKDFEYKNCGTTISGFFITGNAYYTINIGDSRVYLWNKETLCRETHDHSIVQQLIDCGEITEAQAFTHPQRNIMTSAIGQDLSMMQIEIQGPRSIEHGDILMAFSDGVHDALTDDQIYQIVKHYQTTPGLANALTEAAYNAGGKDNTTAVIYRFLE